MVIIQNKIDLVDKAVVTPEEATALAEKVKLKLVMTSVQENYNVENVFQYLAGEYVKKLRDREEQAKHAPTVRMAIKG